MEIKGTIVQSLGVESGTSKNGNAWSKARIVVETEGQYPKKILLTNFKNAETFAKLAVGTIGTFSIEIESREWTNQNTGRTSWSTEVTCWKWNVGGVQPAQAPVQQGWQTAYQQPQQQAQSQPTPPPTQDDDLPF